MGSVVDSETGGGDGVGDAGVDGLTGRGDTVELGGDREETEAGSSEGGAENKKDREIDGAGVVVEEGEA